MSKCEYLRRNAELTGQILSLFPSPRPNGFPSPPPVSFPKRDERFALRGPLGETFAASLKNQRLHLLGALHKIEELQHAPPSPLAVTMQLEWGAHAPRVQCFAPSRNTQRRQHDHHTVNLQRLPPTGEGASRHTRGRVCSPRPSASLRLGERGNPSPP